VPDSEIDDPLIADPIRPAATQDYHNGTLIVSLNRAVNPQWETCFRMRATRFSANVSSAIISFHGDKAHIIVTEHFLQEGVNFLKEYCLLANETYAAQVKQQHQKAIEHRRAELKRRVAESEAKMKILQKVQI